MAEIVYLSLGTNLEDRFANLENAIKSLAGFCRNLEVSSVYETEPWGFLDQPVFLNQVAQAETSLAPLKLLESVKSLETELGRRPNFRNGPRLIDIDILFYGSLVLESPPLNIPHPSLTERAFVLVPLAELAPELVHPVLGKSMAALLAGLDAGGVKLAQRS